MSFSFGRRHSSQGVCQARCVNIWDICVTNGSKRIGRRALAWDMGLRRSHVRRGLGKWCEPHGPCGWLRVLPGQVGIRHGVSVTTTCPSRWRRRARQQQRHRAGGGKGAAAGDWPVLSGSRHVCGVAKPTVGRRAVGSGSRRPRGTCWRRQRSLAVTAVCVGSGARCQPGCCGGQRGALSTRGSEVG